MQTVCCDYPSPPLPFAIMQPTVPMVEVLSVQLFVCPAFLCWLTVCCDYPSPPPFAIMQPTVLMVEVLSVQLVVCPAFVGWLTVFVPGREHVGICLKLSRFVCRLLLFVVWLHFRCLVMRHDSVQ